MGISLDKLVTKSFSRRLGLSALVLSLAGTGCGVGSEALSPCKNDNECGEGRICVEQKCVYSKGTEEDSYSGKNDILTGLEVKNTLDGAVADEYNPKPQPDSIIVDDGKVIYVDTVTPKDNLSLDEYVGKDTFQPKDTTFFYDTVIGGDTPVIYDTNWNDTSCEWQCNNGECIPQSWVCDGMTDCSNGEDEWGCPGYDVGWTPDTYVSPDILCEWQCTITGECIPLSYLCDGYNDCPVFGEDEKNCEPACVDECTSNKDKTCSGSVYIECKPNFDADDCLDAKLTQCTAGTICSPNEGCVADCVNECDYAGQKSCQGNSPIFCTDYDSDPCLEWDNLGDCGLGYTCQDGECVKTCVDECNYNGEKACINYGGGVEYISICGYYEEGGCLELIAEQQCKYFEKCQDGECICKNYNCSSVGEVACNSMGDKVYICGMDKNGCFDWVDINDCSFYGKVCQDGECVASCTDDIGCSYDGQVFCDGNLPMKCLTYLDGDECLDSYNTANECSSSGKVCQDGKCVSSCIDECFPSGKKECSGKEWKQCDNYDADTCLEWSTLTSCTIKENCVGGDCVLKSGCYYNNPACLSNQECINNVCIPK